MATCGYVCPKCEGKGFLDDLSICNWCNALTNDTTDKIVIYHNNSCSKSITSMAILENKKIDFTVIDYLQNPPTHDELQVILRKLNLAPFDLVRKNEPIYLEKFLDKNLTNDEWIAVMIANPVLIERPIIVNGNKAVIGRPPEKVLEIL